MTKYYICIFFIFSPYSTVEKLPQIWGSEYPAVNSMAHQDWLTQGARPLNNIKTIFPMYGYSHVKDKTVGETVLSLTWESLYWYDDIFIMRQPPGHLQPCYWPTLPQILSFGSLFAQGISIHSTNCKIVMLTSLGGIQPHWDPFPYNEGILPNWPYLPCVSMAGRAFLAGYPR